MRAPAFWDHDGVVPSLLGPVASVVARATARRVVRPGWRAPIPVLCCGGASVGGAGKTTLAINLLIRLRARGVDAHALTRGYGGRTRGVLRVDPATHDAALTGDEALLLAEAAPTWVSPDRVAGARAAIGAGATAIVMDDGLQNPGLVKTAALLAVDGGSGFGNGRVMPAGPLREPVAAAAARCWAAVMIGADRTGAAAMLPSGLPVLHARLVPAERLDGVSAFAVSGIARPEKFTATLREAGAAIMGEAAFPDHHRYTARDLAPVLDRAAGAVLVTTAKDAVRLPPALRERFRVVRIRLEWDDPAALDALLTEVLAE